MIIEWFNNFKATKHKTNSEVMNTDSVLLCYSDFYDKLISNL